MRISMHSFTHHILRSSSLSMSFRRSSLPHMSKYEVQHIQLLLVKMIETKLNMLSHSTTSTAQEKSPELTTSNPWAIDLWQEPTCNCTRFLDNPIDLYLNTVLHFNKLPFYEHFKCRFMNVLDVLVTLFSTSFYDNYLNTVLHLDYRFMNVI